MNSGGRETLLWGTKSSSINHVYDFKTWASTTKTDEVLILTYQVIMIMNQKIKTKNIKTSCQLRLSVCSDLPELINRTDYIKINTSKNLTLNLATCIIGQSLWQGKQCCGFFYAEIGMKCLNLSPLSHHKADDKTAECKIKPFFLNKMKEVAACSTFNTGQKNTPYSNHTYSLNYRTQLITKCIII
jgi:hypothetical protein